MANILAKEGREKRPKKMTLTIRRQNDKNFGRMRGGRKGQKK
jgi:hypothetical protein